MKCPECGEEKNIDWISEDNKYTYWKCFMCEHKWKVEYIF